MSPSKLLQTTPKCPRQKKPVTTGKKLWCHDFSLILFLYFLSVLLAGGKTWQSAE